MRTLHQLIWQLQSNSEHLGWYNGLMAAAKTKKEEDEACKGVNKYKRKVYAIRHRIYKVIGERPV